MTRPENLIANLDDEAILCYNRYVGYLPKEIRKDACAQEIHMTSEKKRRLHKVYGVVLSVLILLTGGCLAISCISIYKSGDAPFTYESIAAHFDRIAIPVYLCIGGVLGGFLVTLVWPLEEKSFKPRREEGVVLKRLTARLDTELCDAETLASIFRERRMRRIVTVTATVVGVASFAYPLLLCFKKGAFTVENLNGDVIAASLAVLPAAVLALTAGIAARLLCGASVSRETALVKAALAAGHKKTAVTSDVTPKADRPRVRLAIRSAILAIAVLLIILGVCNGGMADVLGKAIRICTECIGLG